MSSPTDPELAALLGEIPDPAAARSVAPPRELPTLPEAPTRQLVRRRRIAALIVGISWVGALLAVYGVRTDLRHLPPLYLSAQILVPALLGTGSLVVAVGPGKLGLGARIGLVSTLAVLGPVSFWLLAVGAPVPRVVESGTWVDAVLCFDITMLWVAVPLLCAALTLRGAFAAGARWRSALVGAAIGLFAGATMNLHCTNAAPSHMLLGHGLAVVLAALLGAVVLVKRTGA